MVEAGAIDFGATATLSTSGPSTDRALGGIGRHPVSPTGIGWNQLPTALFGPPARHLVTFEEDVWYFEQPPFRLPPRLPWRLRHAGLRAPDLIYLMRAGLVPELRSADVLVCSNDEAGDLADCAELHSFVRGLRCDQDAVTAGLSLLWNSGAVEGHVNRTKMLKRRMFGRAKPDLLRK
ncbi:hypothetical protein ACWEKR_31910 [Nocardia sp. NPDC004573]